MAVKDKFWIFWSETYVVNEFQLLSCDERAVVEGQRKVRGQPGYIAQPKFEKSHFDEYQLIILTQVYETCAQHFWKLITF